MKQSKHSIAGFSLVEMMVALVAGMIVVAAVLAFTVSSVRANSDYVLSTRLMQELRNTMGYLAAELRRAGYDEKAMNYVANPSSLAVSALAPMKIDTASSCILYAYDRADGTPGVVDYDNQELRGIRRKTATVGGATVGVIEVAESSATATPTCDGTQPDYSIYPMTCASSGWCPLTDPRQIDVTDFTIDADGAGAVSNGVRVVSGTSGTNTLQLREIQLTIAGRMRSDPNATRSVRSNIKVRADCLRANVSGCEGAPSP